MELIISATLWLIAWLLFLTFGALAVYLGAMAWRTTALAAQAERLAPPIGQIRRISVPGGRAQVHFLERAPAGRGDEGDAPPAIVLLHGNGGSLRHFSSAILDALARETFAQNRRVIALDRPGSGYSTPADSASPAAQSQWLWAALSALDVRDAILVGHSLGGAVVLRMALDAPERTRALALLAPAVTPFRPKPPLDAPVIRSAWLRRLLAVTIAVPTTAARGPATVAAVFAPDPAPADYATAGGGVLNLRPSQAETVMADWAALNDGLADQVGRYGDITAPAHVLLGARDAILDPAQQADALRALRAGRVETLSEAGHMLPFAWPAETIAAIRAAAEAAEAAR